MKKGNLKLFISKQGLKYFLASSMLNILQVVCVIAIPILLDYFNSFAKNSDNKDKLIFGSSIGLNWQIAILLVIILAISGFLFLFGYIGNKYSIKFSKTVAINMRSLTYSNVLHFSQSDVEHFGQSSIINRLVIDISTITTAMETASRMLVKSILMYFGGLVGLVITVFTNNSINTAASSTSRPPWLVLVIIIVISITLLTIIVVLALCSQKSFKQAQTELDNMNYVAQENVVGQKAVKSFVLQQSQYENFEKTNLNLSKAATKAGCIIAGILPTIYFFLDCSMLVVVWISDANSIKSVMSTFILISLMVIALILSIVGIAQVSRAIPSYKRMTELALYKPQIEYLEKEAKLSKDNSIIIKKLNFKYPNAKVDSLKDINIEIKSGDVVGLIGSTGSGKSTLINLLMRMYDSNCGTIKLSETSIKKFSKNQLKENISYCPQNVVLFEGTIKSNILFGKPDANDQEVENAAKLACLYDFVVSKPNKFDSEVAQRGKNLSGGQKQRLSLARALIKDSPYLFLDDATSALDMITEKTICDQLIQNKKKQTILIASQRITAIKNMKKIIVIENGKIIGFGNHKHLLKNCDYYYNVAVAQLGEQEVLNEIS
ncbi:MAG: ABC transporter ATP-binding protein/permease [Ureaplasma sp.]|nr:ABC transporter ATP-binding protein/permease [Ureaplasma sp.]